MNENQNLKIKHQNLNQNSKLEVRYRAFYLSIKIIKFLDSLPQKNSLRIISNQLIRCVTSIGANIVEAKAAASKREFLNYFQIALKSSNESKYWLELLKYSYLASTKQIDPLLSELQEITNMIASGILKLKGKKL